MTVEHARTLHSPNQHIHTLNDRVWRLERDRCDCTKIPTSQPADIVLGDSPPPPPPPPPPADDVITSNMVWVIDYENQIVRPATNTGAAKPGTALRAPGVAKNNDGSFRSFYFYPDGNQLIFVNFSTDGGHVVGKPPTFPNVRHMQYVSPYQTVITQQVGSSTRIVLWDPINGRVKGNFLDITGWNGKGLASWWVDTNGELVVLKLEDSGIVYERYGSRWSHPIRDYNQAIEGFQVYENAPLIDHYGVLVKSSQAGSPGPKHFRLININGGYGKDYFRGQTTDGFTLEAEDIVSVVQEGLVRADGHVLTTTSVGPHTNTPMPSIPGYELRFYSDTYGQAVYLKPGEWFKTAIVVDKLDGTRSDLSTIKVLDSNDYDFAIIGNLRYKDKTFWRYE